MDRAIRDGLRAIRAGFEGIPEGELRELRDSCNKALGIGPDQSMPVLHIPNGVVVVDGVGVAAIDMARAALEASLEAGGTPLILPSDRDPEGNMIWFARGDWSRILDGARDRVALERGRDS